MKKIFLILILIMLCGCTKEKGSGMGEEDIPKGFLNSPYTVDLKEPTFGDFYKSEELDNNSRIIIYYNNVSLFELKNYINEIKDKFYLENSILDLYEESKIYKYTAKNDQFKVILLLDENTLTIDASYNG